MMRTIELHGGPLDGQTHTIEDPLNLGEPAMIGLPVNPPEREPRAWYERGEEGVYRFVRVGEE